MLWGRKELLTNPLKKSPEKRAVAYSYIVDVFLFLTKSNGNPQPGRCLLENDTTGSEVLLLWRTG